MPRPIPPGYFLKLPKAAVPNYASQICHLQPHTFANSNYRKQQQKKATTIDHQCQKLFQQTPYVCSLNIIGPFLYHSDNECARSLPIFTYTYMTELALCTIGSLNPLVLWKKNSLHSARQQTWKLLTDVHSSWERDSSCVYFGIFLINSISCVRAKSGYLVLLAAKEFWRGILKHVSWSFLVITGAKNELSYNPAPILVFFSDENSYLYSHLVKYGWPREASAMKNSNINLYNLNKRNHSGILTFCNKNRIKERNMGEKMFIQ